MAIGTTNLQIHLYEICEWNGERISYCVRATFLLPNYEIVIATFSIYVS